MLQLHVTLAVVTWQPMSRWCALIRITWSQLLQLTSKRSSSSWRNSPSLLVVVTRLQHFEHMMARERHSILCSKLSSELDGKQKLHMYGRYTKSHRGESNSWPLVYKTSALTTELQWLIDIRTAILFFRHMLCVITTECVKLKLSWHSSPLAKQQHTHAHVLARAHTLLTLAFQLVALIPEQPQNTPCSSHNISTKDLTPVQNHPGGWW